MTSGAAATTTSGGAAGASTIVSALMYRWPPHAEAVQSDYYVGKAPHMLLKMVHENVKPDQPPQQPQVQPTRTTSRSASSPPQPSSLAPYVVREIPFFASLTVRDLLILISKELRVSPSTLQVELTRNGRALPFHTPCTSILDVANLALVFTLPNTDEQSSSAAASAATASPSVPPRRIVVPINGGATVASGTTNRGPLVHIFAMVVCAALAMTSLTFENKPKSPEEMFNPFGAAPPTPAAATGVASRVQAASPPTSPESTPASAPRSGEQA